MSPQDRRTVRTVLLVLACVLLVGLVWVGGRDSTTAEPGVQPGSGQSASGQSASSGQHRGTNGLPSVSVADLPPEARHTLELIRSDGPFPYSRDGVVFQNRERLLPREKSGYYHEYTVPTPGEADRGARRIITGKAGERYYTDDHYASFRVVEEQP
jgi:ribonuclease T1